MKCRVRPAARGKRPHRREIPFPTRASRLRPDHPVGRALSPRVLERLEEKKEPIHHQATKATKYTRKRKEKRKRRREKEKRSATDDADGADEMQGGPCARRPKESANPGKARFATSHQGRQEASRKRRTLTRRRALRRPARWLRPRAGGRARGMRRDPRAPGPRRRASRASRCASGRSCSRRRARRKSPKGHR